MHLCSEVVDGFWIQRKRELEPARAGYWGGEQGSGGAVEPKKKLNIAIAGVLGLMVGVFGAFAVEYFEGWGKEGKEGG